MSFFSIFKLGTMYQTIPSLMPKVLNMTSAKSSCTILRNFHYMCEKQPLHLIPNILAYNNKSLLAQPSSPVINQVCGMKVKGRLELRCKDCYYIARRERLFVMCKTHPRHKQTQMKKRDYKTWILTHATQSPRRPW